MKHHSDLRFCGCRSCRGGLHGHHKTGRNFYAKLARHQQRKTVKMLIRQARYDEIPERFGVPYTD